MFTRFDVPRVVVSAALCSLAWCAAPLEAQTINATVVLAGFRGVVRMDTIGTAVPVRGSPGAVFTALRNALDSLGVAATVRDSAAGVVGNLELKLTRRFANKAMSTWVDCGIGHTGPTANAYRVNMAIMAGVATAKDGGSNVRIAVAAGAQAFSGPLGDPIACESTGAIERRVLDIVQAHVGKP